MSADDDRECIPRDFATRCRLQLPILGWVLCAGLAALAGCGDAIPDNSPSTVVNEGGALFADHPPVRAVCRATHDGTVDSAYFYGTFLSECSDLDGDGHAEVVAMYYRELELDVCRVDVISFPGRKVLNSLTVDQCAFTEGAAQVADVDGDGGSELLVITPAVASLSRWDARQRLEVFALDQGKQLVSCKLRELDGRGARIVGVISDLDGDGWRECVVSYPPDRAVVLSLPTAKTLYEVMSPVIPAASGTSKPCESRGVTCGDLNADMVTDYLIAYPLLGICGVYSGSNGDPIRTLTIGPPGLADLALHHAEDMLGPDHPGLVVGSRLERRGVIRVFDLRSGAMTMEWESNDAYSELGSQVSTLDDWDGDGIREVLMCGVQGAPTRKEQRHGVAAILPSKEGRTPIVLLGRDPTTLFGSAVCRLGALGRERVQSFLVGERGEHGTPGKDGRPLYGFYSGNIWMFDCDRFAQER